MARDYSSALRQAKGIWIPRWIVIAVAVLFFGMLALRILRPPQWVIQRLDSPDGSLSAELWTVKYLDYAYRVKVKHGAVWHTVFNGPEFKADFKVNYRPTLYWDAQSEYLVFTIEGQPVMVYSAELQRQLSGNQAQPILKERFDDWL